MLHFDQTCKFLEGILSESLIVQIHSYQKCRFAFDSLLAINFHWCVDGSPGWLDLWGFANTGKA